LQRAGDRLRREQSIVVLQHSRREVMGLRGLLWWPGALALLACGARTGLEVAIPPASGDAGPDASGPCPTGAVPTELAYVLDAVGTIHRYDPHTARAETLGTPDCGNSNVHWTMTATPDTAYIVYTDWTLYAVDLATLACSKTAFDPGPLGNVGEFGVAAVGSGPSAKLFVYGLPTEGDAPVLAVADVGTFALTSVGSIQPAPPPSSFPVNLTADTAGELYAYSPGGLVQRIDAASGSVLQSRQSDVLTMSTWATIAYTPDLYLWADSRVVGYDLSSGAHTSEHDTGGISAIGASSFVACSR
jgi:hypothetical protein